MKLSQKKKSYNLIQNGRKLLNEKCGFHVFSGPDGIGDYKVKRCDFPHSVGVGSKLPEATSELSYLCRAAPGTPTPMPKQCYVGGVGWGVEDFYMLNMRTLNSNMQLKRAEFRQETEDRVTHRYQNPW
uniref:Uncharacterized protein n=1 Tax=Erpetoichthys calabaricus TaxID=27687 RepID=A0A8C4RSQ6_ERPCA